MALVSCPECGREVSEKATACPNCGAPLNGKKFCKHCGEKIDNDCVVCPKCGKQVEQLNDSSKNIVINNSASASASATVVMSTNLGRPRNKWVALALCVFTICGHKFYEGKAGMGILYLLTAGLFGIGWIADIISLLCKPNPYYV